MSSRGQTLVIERYTVEVYNKDADEWEELLGNYSVYLLAAKRARDLADGGSKTRIIAQKYEYTDSELVEEFESEHGPDEDDG